MDDFWNLKNIFKKNFTERRDSIVKALCEEWLEEILGTSFFSLLVFSRVSIICEKTESKSSARPTGVDRELSGDPFWFTFYSPEEIHLFVT